MVAPEAEERTDSLAGLVDMAEMPPSIALERMVATEAEVESKSYTEE
jgi:hypothetical protein